MRVDGAVERWLGRLRCGSGALRVFSRFFDEVLAKEFPGLSPAEIVEWQRGTADRFRILELAENWLNGLDLRYRSKRQYLAYIRSFFLHNRAELPRDPGFRFDADRPPVEGRLDCDAFRRILHNSSRMYRAVFLMMAQGLMGEGELVYVNVHLWRDVLRHIKRDDGVFKLVLPGRKRSRNRRNFYTLLSTESDWAEHFRLYLHTLSHKLDGCLFRNKRGNPLREHNIRNYFHWRAVEAGVIQQHTPACPHCHGDTVRKRRRYPSGIRKIAYVCRECGEKVWARDINAKWRFRNVRYGVNPHEIRDLMRSRWQVSGADTTVAEFMMGHVIDVNNYNKFTKYEPWYPIQEYRKALPWLNILSEEPSKVDRSQLDEELMGQRAEVEALRRRLVELERERVDTAERLKRIEEQLLKL